ncbi:protein phosphatase 2C domain-containing protein [Plantactinospora sp. B6F1]|uniref:PP2C family protein-serine/threonine phosphatase n=1 Tax=Plantactinospora sp. B6F1 TaxID=3158971 RepID=UPI0032D95630
MTAVGAGSAGSMPKPCPEHGAPDDPAHRYCEVCGRELERVPVGEVTGPSGGTSTATGSSAPAESSRSGTATASGRAEVSGPVGSAESTELLRQVDISGPTSLSRLEALAGPTGSAGASSAPSVAQGRPGELAGSVPPAPPSGVPGWGPPAQPTAPAGPENPAVHPPPAAPPGWAGPTTPLTPPGWAGPSAPPAPPGWTGPAGSAGGAATPGTFAVGVPAVPTGPLGPSGSWLSSRAVGQPCPSCGTPPSGDSGHCDHCGRRSSVGRDRADLDLGAVAAVTDRARRRRNEDAVAVGRLGPAIAAVVCDGVSTSLRADLAAHGAAEAALATMLSALGSGAAPPDAVVASGRAGAEAARATALQDDGQVPPSCTFVAAIVTAGSVTVGWIGDSRAYWLGPDGAVHEAVCLTVDDSVVGQIRAGRPVPPGAEQDPTSKALIRWLGADSGDTDPQVVTFQPGRPGRLVICSDGLSHYLPNAGALAARVPGPGGGTPIAIAQDLTRFAAEAGGHDNIAVAVLPFPPAGGMPGAGT